MSGKFYLTGIATVAMAFAVLAQSPAPVIVQAVPAATPPVVAAAPVTPAGASAAEAIKALLLLKAANEELLKKQAATLQQLDELEKAVEQIKIYSKRG